MQQGLKAIQDHKVLQVSKVRQVHVVLRVRRGQQELLVTRVLPVQLVQPVQPAQLVLLATRVMLVYLVFQAQQVQLVIKAQLALLEQPARLVIRVRLAPQVFLEQWDLRVQPVQPVLQALHLISQQNSFCL